MGVVGVSWDLLGLFRGRLWVSWGPLGGLMTHLGILLGSIGGVLGASWGASGGTFGNVSEKLRLEVCFDRPYFETLQNHFARISLL